ncbi:MAG: hydrogenase maturation protease [Promethearchaeota archaeon]
MNFTDFKRIIENYLSHCRRLAIIGIGTYYRCDDAVGSVLMQELIKDLHDLLEDQGLVFQDYSGDEYLIYKDLLLLNATVVPEQYTTKICEFAPDHVLILDAAQMGPSVKPGDLALLKKDELKGRLISTHAIPLNQFIDFLNFFGKNSMKFIIIAIQIQSLDYGESISEPVIETKNFLKAFILNYIKKNFFRQDELKC